MAPRLVFTEFSDMGVFPRLSVPAERRGFGSLSDQGARGAGLARRRKGARKWAGLGSDPPGRSPFTVGGVSCILRVRSCLRRRFESRSLTPG